MKNSDYLQFGAYQIINNCLRVKSGEKICIVTDLESDHIGNAIFQEALKVTKEVALFTMENYGKRSEDGSSPLAFPDEIAGYLRGCQASVYAATGKKGELKSFRTPMTAIVNELKTIRHAHMPGINDRIMATGMAADYQQISDNNAKVMQVLKGAHRARVTTKLGTDFEVTFDPSWKWINCDGIIQADNWSNLPDGEIFTCAKDANGTVVIDGILGDYLNDQFGKVDENPVTMKIRDGRMQSVECANSEIVRELTEYSKQDENANRIGEFAIGTNLGLTELIGNLLQDEKFPGVHIALGHGYPEKTGSNWNSEAHLDMIITKTTVEIDGKQIMKDGVFVE